jgi:hypothetical protein
MAQEKCTADEFISLIEQHGVAGTARILGVNERNVYSRRKRLEREIGRKITSPHGPGKNPDSPSAPPTAKPRYRLRLDGTFEEVEPPPAAPTGEIERLRATVSRLRGELKQALRESADDSHVRQAIFSLAESPGEVPDWVIDTHPASGSAGIPMTIWSDWHWAEVVRPTEVSGLNEYNLVVAHDRVRRLVGRIVDLCFEHMVNPSYPGIVVCLGGDMISGEIHQELAESNELSTAPALMDLLGVLIWAIGVMAERFGRVFVPCVVGNHGRMTAKPRAKGRVHSSFEWILYQMLERHFLNDDRVRFMVPGEADAPFSVAGHRYLLTHGDSLGVKGGDSFIGLLGPIARGTIKLRVSEAQIGRDFDTLVMGHWHQALWLPGAVVNGTLKGYDEFARLFLRARYQPPTQLLWFVHPKHGSTFHIPVFVDESRVADAPWVTWPEAA